ncbi:MAG: hypothetical protein D6737_05065 [Chloroflexi bacterium]|nr:MAG: hypothetical protein D6737_05065 [Chloroflexota bacterium]
MADIELLIEQLYEDIALRDELTDEEADTLLRWGEAQAEQLVAASTDAATFDARFAALRTVMKHINKFTGKRAKMDAAAQRLQLKQFMQAAQEFGITITPQQIEMYLQQHATLSHHDNVHAMLALLAGDLPKAHDDMLKGY